MPRWPRRLAAAFGFVWFLQLVGPATLNPLNTAWLFDGDWRQHWLGFLFYLREPWTFPLGEVSALLYPIGTNIGLTDSNPLVAILVKPFAGFLPSEFQIIGPWLAACFILQGYFGARLVAAVTSEPAHQLLGGLLMVLSPVLAVRLGHDTLCAHWLILWVLDQAVRKYPPAIDGSRLARRLFAPVLIAAAVHPYLTAMVGTLAISVLIRLWMVRALDAFRAAGWIAGIVAAPLAVFGLIGFFAHGRDGGGGFEQYRADLLALVDPAGSSLLFRGPWFVGSWEGLGFLGLGGVLALLLVTPLLVRDWRKVLTSRPGVAAPVAVCLLMAFYSLSSGVSLAGEEIARLDWLYAPMMTVVAPFRSAGRFMWPLHYLVLLAGIWGAGRVFHRFHVTTTTAVLVVLVALQAIDLPRDRVRMQPADPKHIALEPYNAAGPRYRHLALVPMQVPGLCTFPYQEDYVYRFMLLAYRVRLTFNSGNYARLDYQRGRQACDALERSIDAGHLDGETIYVVSAQNVERMNAAGAACGRWDGNWICVRPESDEAFAKYISTGKRPADR